MTTRPAAISELAAAVDGIAGALHDGSTATSVADSLDAIADQLAGARTRRHGD